MFNILMLVNTRIFLKNTFEFTFWIYSKHAYDLSGLIYREAGARTNSHYFGSSSCRIVHTAADFSGLLRRMDLSQVII